MRFRVNHVIRTLLLTTALATGLAAWHSARAAGPTAADPLAAGFVHPPASARPWVYWFPLDGNISSNGITADLEAMQRVGIGGVLYMETDQGAPRGPAAFGGPLWRELFRHICAEAARLGLEVNMNNDAGWCGSGGPWITPELSMQRVVWAETNLVGPQRFSAVLPQPKATRDFYRDIALFAFPTPSSNYVIPHLRGKSADAREEISPRASFPALASEATIARDRLLILTPQLGRDGRLAWEVPAGRWTLLRLGHTSTGKDNHPAPLAGRGLECDKLSTAAVEAMFAGLMARLIDDSRPLVGQGKTLVSTHIDSWEVGSQNWTPRFREEFQRLRGYDPLPYLPVMRGRVIDSLEISERFLWDVRQTVNDLLVDNYAGHFRAMARQHGLRLSIEAYDGVPADDMTYAGRADEPMGEFWSYAAYSGSQWCTEMASAAHVYGKPILGAEAFTATDAEKWQAHPGSIKAMGDWAFCEGINRFVFHRYALQPWTRPDRPPGMSMGPWGLHYERTQTWWEQSRAWHEYLARCQFLLQQGFFVADLCFLAPEMSPQRFKSPVKSGLDRPGYNFDGCPPEVVLTRMKVEDGRLVLPDGMSYRALVLPHVETMTPGLLRKIKDLVAAGATVVGAPPVKSPSLSHYPQCDDEIKALTRELWGTGEAPTKLSAHRFGKGRLYWGGEFRARSSETPESENQLGKARWIWRREGNPAAAAPPGKRYFRHSLTVDAGSPIAAARLVMTADNSFECWINGQQAGAGDSFNRTSVMNVASLLKAGRNVLAVAAVNATDSPNPAGLIGRLTIRHRDGRTQEVTTDGTWEAAAAAQGAWRTGAGSSDDWTSALDLGPLGMEPWGDIEQASPATDPIPDVKVLCRWLAGMGVPPDFSYQARNSAQALRYIHKRISDTDVYFVANKNPQSEEALCSFRVQDRRPELWWPDTGRLEPAAVYDQADGCVRVPIRFEPSGSVFVIFRSGARLERDRVTSVSRDGEALLTAGWKAPSEARTDNNAGLTNTFTLAAWVRPEADTDLPPETNRGLSGYGRVRNDALFPPPGHEVYAEDGQAGAGLAVGRNGVCVFEHGADYFAPVLVLAIPLTNWVHLAVVYRDGVPSLYLNGKFARQGLRGPLTVHPGVGVTHGRQVPAFKGDLGDFEQFDRALTERAVRRLAQSMIRPVSRQQSGSVQLVREPGGPVQALVWQPGTYALETANRVRRQWRVGSIPAPLEIPGPWRVRFPPERGAPAEVTLDRLVSWSEHGDAGVRHFSGAATYTTTFQAPSALLTAGRRFFLDLGRLEVMAEVKLNGQDFGILWKAPFRIDVSRALSAGQNTLEVKVVNTWINRMIGDELLGEDSDRKPDGTLKSWPAWLEQGKPSPSGRYTFTSWRLWRKGDPLQPSGLLGPVVLQVAEALTVPLSP
jgi:hypothetical protein